MKTFRGEFHLHTVLSPCAELEMLPPLIVSEAIEKQLDFIAVTDHNHTGNIEAVWTAAKGSGLHVIPGMEIQSKEEVHLLCLFDEIDQARALQAKVDQNLPDLSNNAELFGNQLFVDHAGDFVSSEERLLLTSVNLSVNEIWDQVTKLEGLVMPAHVDRSVNGMIPILGFIPPDIAYPAIEISRNLSISGAHQRYPQLRNYTLTIGGDAHRLDDILGASQLNIETIRIEELLKAFSSAEGRSMRALSQSI